MSASFLFLSLAVVLNAGSGILYKWASASGGALATALFLAGITLGGVNAFFYTRSLAGIRLNVAYPVFSAGSVLLVTLASLLIFAETLSVRQGLGIAVALAGVALVTVK
jgi:spermidine export protein MdtJ